MGLLYLMPFERVLLSWEYFRFILYFDYSCFWITHSFLEGTKIFFNFHPSISALATKQDGYTECFDERITEEIRYFFFHFSQHYPRNCSYINNIKPFIEVSDLHLKDEDLSSLIYPIKLSTNSNSPKDSLHSIEDKDLVDF